MSSASVVEVALALVWRHDCLLITRRKEGTHLGGLWEIPGGKLEPGESPEACAAREVLEEVGVRCRPMLSRAVIEWEYPERQVRLHPVDCEYVGGPPRPLQVAEWAWVRPAQLTEYAFPPANAALIQEIIQAAQDTAPERLEQD